MIIPKHAITDVLEGRVTTARLPEHRWSPKAVESLRSAHVSKIRDEDENLIRTDRRAGMKLCKLKIVRYELVPLETEDPAVDDLAARRDGYRDHEDWMRSYFDAYGGSITQTMGWLVTFQVDRSEPVRLLANVSGYTTSSLMALPEEPEAVSEQVIDQFVQQNDARWKAARGDEHARRELNRLGRSVREEGLRAIRAGRDVSENLDRIQRELDAIRQNREAA